MQPEQEETAARAAEAERRTAEDAGRLHEPRRLVEQARAEVLRRSEAKYWGILQTSADAIVCADEQQRITLFNRAAEQAFGYERDEVIGAPLDVLIPERLRAAYRAHVARFASGAQPSLTISEPTAQLFGRRKDGEEFPFDATVSKVTLDGEVIVTAAVRDVTAKLRGEIEGRLLSEVGRALAARIDEDLALTTLTKLAVRELGDVSSLYLLGEDGAVQRQSVICREPESQWFCELMMGLPVDRRSLHPVWQVLDTRRPSLVHFDAQAVTAYALSEEHRRALEALRFRSVIGVPLLAGAEVAGALFVASRWPSRAFDDRDLRLMEEIARRAALSLENARLYRAAQSALRARDEVLGIVAHDLRNSLGSILLNASLQRRADHPERRSQRHVQSIERAISYMDCMIGDLLDVTRIEAGHLVLERVPVAPRDLLADAVEAHERRAAAQSIALRFEAAADLPAAHVDRGRVLQVFENLIANAVRVTAGGKISLAARARDGQIVFSVADSGPGIAPDDLPHVFDRFWHARTTRRGGAGLGLSIVKGIVEAHGGRTWLESELGRGTTVFFTLPIAAASPNLPIRDSLRA